MPQTILQELLSEFLEDLPLMLAAGLIYWFVRRHIHKKRFGSGFKEVRQRARLNEIIGLLLVMWAALIVCSTLMPPWGEFRHLSIFINFIPRWELIPEELLKIIRHGFAGASHELLNVLMFVPIGLALPFVLKSHKFGQTVLVGFCFTFAIEFLQGFSNQRDGNTDDLICNTLGVIVGYLLFLLIKLILPKFTEKCMTKAE